MYTLGYYLFNIYHAKISEPSVVVKYIFHCNVDWQCILSFPTVCRILVIYSVTTMFLPCFECLMLQDFM